LSSRPFDIAVFGATGFTGRYVAEHLAQHAPQGTKLALAGRDLAKLEGVARGLASKVELIRADSTDAASLQALAEQTKVVCTTVGPYQKYGLPLVEACARAGTHLCDINGETLYVRDCIDRYDAVAKQTGARIVNSCGFDSVPSDVGLWVLHQAAKEPLEDAALVIDSMRGAFSGGTFASLMATLDVAREDKSKRKLLFDPYSLSPDRAAEPDLGPQRDPSSIRRDELVGGLTAPFVMGTINTRIVRRSNALLGHAYGRKLKYRELSLLKKKPSSIVAGAGLPLAFLAITRLRQRALGRKLLDRVMPKPGEGPSEEQRRTGFYKGRMIGRTESGKKWTVRLFGAGDPGYSATARILGECALALAFDELPPRFGVLTPATALVPAILPRLRQHQVTFDVEQ
jgi:short subunit dehydrogenase-like uncharacterized protein